MEILSTHKSDEGFISRIFKGLNSIIKGQLDKENEQKIWRHFTQEINKHPEKVFNLIRHLGNTYSNHNERPPNTH